MDRVLNALRCQWIADRPWPLGFILALAVLCAASYGVLNTAARYVDAPAEVTAGVAPPLDLRLWQQTTAGITFDEEADMVIARLMPRGAGQSAVLQAPVALPPNVDALRITLKLGAEKLRPGRRSWQTAKVELLGFGQSGDFLWYWPREVAVLSSDQPFSPVTAVLPIEAGPKHAVLRIYNGAESGVLRAGAPEVAALSERPAFVFMRGALVLAWVVGGLFLARALLRRVTSRLRAGLLLGLMVFALVGTLTPQPYFRSVTAPLEGLALAVADYTVDRLRSWIRTPPGTAEPRDLAKDLGTAPSNAAPKTSAANGSGQTPPKDRSEGRAEVESESETANATAETSAARAPPQIDYPFNPKQIGHFAAFFLLGLAGFAAFPQAPWAGRLVCLSSFALATESLQWFVVSRNSAVPDLVADLIGLALAASVVAVLSGIKVAARARTRDRAARGGRS